MKFKALQVIQDEKKDFSREIVLRTLADLPAGELLVKVHYSSLNFKDALAATGQPGVVRRFPHTPGIDAAGEVVSCEDGSFQPGDQVIVTSYDLGIGVAGGFGQVIRVPSKWAIPLPEGLSLKDSMMLGTAGLTAARSIQELVENGVTPAEGPVLVTGATGGVGSLTVAMLAKLGYRVTAVTGKLDQEESLKELGAERVLSREKLLVGSQRPMLRTTWAGVVDCVGGEMLAAAIKSAKYAGVVICCGMVESIDIPINVLPFILRGVRLIGIDSAECPMPKRTSAWERLASDWKPDHLHEMVDEVGLEGLEEKIQGMLKAQLKRKVLVNLQG